MSETYYLNPVFSERAAPRGEECHECYRYTLPYIGHSQSPTRYVHEALERASTTSTPNNKLGIHLLTLCPSTVVPPGGTAKPSMIFRVESTPTRPVGRKCQYVSSTGIGPCSGGLRGLQSLRFRSLEYVLLGLQTTLLKPSTQYDVSRGIRFRGLCDTLSLPCVGAGPEVPLSPSHDAVKGM
jgi:hypothetical protein